MDTNVKPDLAALEGEIVARIAGATSEAAIAAPVAAKVFAFAMPNWFVVIWLAFVQVSVPGM